MLHRRHTHRHDLGAERLHRVEDIVGDPNDAGMHLLGVHFGRHTDAQTRERRVRIAKHGAPCTVGFCEARTQRCIDARFVARVFGGDRMQGRPHVADVVGQDADGVERVGV